MRLNKLYLTRLSPQELRCIAKKMTKDDWSYISMNSNLTVKFITEYRNKLTISLIVRNLCLNFYEWIIVLNLFDLKYCTLHGNNLSEDEIFELNLKLRVETDILSVYYIINARSMKNSGVKIVMCSILISELLLMNIFANIATNTEIIICSNKYALELSKAILLIDRTSFDFRINFIELYLKHCNKIRSTGANLAEIVVS